MLQEKHRKSTLLIDETYEKIQMKNADVLGPLSKVWWALDQTKHNEDGEIKLPTSELLL